MITRRGLIGGLVGSIAITPAIASYSPLSKEDTPVKVIAPSNLNLKMNKGAKVKWTFVPNVEKPLPLFDEHLKLLHMKGDISHLMQKMRLYHNFETGQSSFSIESITTEILRDNVEIFWMTPDIKLFEVSY